MLNDFDIGIGIVPEVVKSVIITQKMVQDLPKFKQSFLDIQPKFT